MATVKFHEGTKNETSLNLEDGEGVVFVRPEKNSIWRTIGTKYWYVNLVITDKRLVTIPLPPNKNNRQVESYFFEDISGIKATPQQDKSQEASMADFAISMKGGGKSSYAEGGVFTIRMVMSFFKIFGMLSKRVGTGMANEFEKSNAQMQAYHKTMESQANARATGASTYTEYSPNFAAMDKAAKARAENEDFSKAGHSKMRDYIVDVVSHCVAISNGVDPSTLLRTFTPDNLTASFTGKARYCWEGGEVYEGDIVKGIFKGKGKKSFPNGNVYEGDFADDKFNGKGKYTWASGDVYEGDFVDYNKQGKGKLTWVNGDVYEGEYANDKRNGKGKTTYANGKVEDGNWKDDKFLG